MDLVGFQVHRTRVRVGNTLAGDGGLDELGQEETQSYRIRLSKFLKGAFAAIRHPLFWYLLQICRVARGPLRHFFLFVEKEGRANNSGQVLFKLATGKCLEFMEEFRGLFDRWEEITSRALELAGAAAGPEPLCEEAIASMKAVGWKLLFQQWSAMQRRIIVPLQQHLACGWPLPNSC